MTGETKVKINGFLRYGLVGLLSAVLAVGGKALTDRISIAEQQSKQDAEIVELKSRLDIVQSKQAINNERIASLEATILTNSDRIKAVEQRLDSVATRR